MSSEIEYEYGVLELVPGEGWSVVTGRPFASLRSAQDFRDYLLADAYYDMQVEVRRRAVGGWEELPANDENPA